MWNLTWLEVTPDSVICIIEGQLCWNSMLGEKALLRIQKDKTNPKFKVIAFGLSSLAHQVWVPLFPGL